MVKKFSVEFSPDELAQIAADDDDDDELLTPAVRQVDASLSEMGRNAVTKLRPNKVQPSKFQDRFDVQEDLSELIDSIERHGQETPIIVRPIPGILDKYEIVAGRRRVAAISELERRDGKPRSVDAIIRELTDFQAVMSQTNENSQRKNISFIERAAFVEAILNSEEYAEDDKSKILDALKVDRALKSRMLTILRNVPPQVLYKLGSQPELGRRPWEELSKDLSELHQLTQIREEDLIALLSDSGRGKPQFEAFAGEIKRILEEARRTRQPQSKQKAIRRTEMIADGAFKLQRGANGITVSPSTKTKRIDIGDLAHAIRVAVEEFHIKNVQ